MPGESDVDILVVGGGVLGVTLTYWLSGLYDCKIAVADLAMSPGMHTTSRNTGVIHRPFYLNPDKKRIFARASLVSHSLWRNLASSGKLPWRPVGTFNVALSGGEARTIQEYHRWGRENGMREDELELMDGRDVRALEPEVSSESALLSKEDVSVDFGAFTRHLWNYLASKGVAFLGGHKLLSLRKKGGAVEAGFRSKSGHSTVRCAYALNAAGGGAVEIAHSAGFGLGCATLNFRGEYWAVDEPLASRVRSNIYRPPRFPAYPFLDPHFVVRADGTRQIGPNAVVVPEPYVYRGAGLSKVGSYLRPPVGPKAGLMTNGDFISLVAREWMSSLSKGVMCRRVKKFVPALDERMLSRRGVAGVRSSVIDSSGFVPEALLFRGEGSAHVINFNSPGATGAPAFSCFVVSQLRREGFLDGFRSRAAAPAFQGWDYESVSAQFPTAAAL